MESKIKIVFYWILLGVCFILHSLLHLSEIYFKENMLIANTNGVLPLEFQVFTILVSVMPFIFAVLSMNLSKKWFLWGSFVWNILLLFLNTFHLVETAREKVLDIAQIVLLLFVLVINILLSATLWKSVRRVKKENNSI